MDRRVKEERRAKRAEKRYTAGELLAKLQAQPSKRLAESLGCRTMIDWQSMSEDEIRRALKDAGIEPISVEVNTSTLTVWMSGTRKDREGRLVPRKFVARRLETVVRQIKDHLLERASD